MAVEIPLTQGKVTIVDDEDAVRVLAYRWQAAKAPSGLWYASASKRDIRRQYRCLHRFILDVTDPDVTVDHRNGNGLDNRQENLRTAAQQQQTWNRRVIDRPKSSRFKGVYWHHNPRSRAGGFWEVHLTANGRRFYATGRTEEDAARAYNRLARQHFGEFAWLNPVEEVA